MLSLRSVQRVHVGLRNRDSDSDDFDFDVALLLRCCVADRLRTALVKDRDKKRLSVTLQRRNGCWAGKKVKCSADGGRCCG